MSQYTVQVFVDQNTFLIGHVAIKLTDASGNTTVVGFYPEDGVTHSLGDALNGFVGYGDVKNDADRISDMEGKSAVIEVSKEQYDAMINYADQVRNDPTASYFLGGNGAGLNCATFAERLLDAGSVPHPDIQMHPYEYLPYSAVERKVLGWLLDLGSSINDIEQPVADFFRSAARLAPIRRDPLTLDLDGDGLETVGTTAGILFDQTGSGVRQGTGWVAPDDGFLVLDRNGNGVIDSGRELFGDSTHKSTGQTALDGFDALRDLDSNADGKISSTDAQFGNLRVWRDHNQDGISQSGELYTLSSLQIASINVAASANSQTLANGNQIADLGTYTRTDGSTGTTGEISGTLGDINLGTDVFHRQFTDTLDTSAVGALPDMQGSGAVRDLREAANDGEWRVAA